MEPLKQMEKKKFYCEICEKEFSRNQNKKQHVNLVHVEEKIFACNVCNQTFENDIFLTQHFRIHEGKKTF